MERRIVAGQILSLKEKTIMGLNEIQSNLIGKWSGNNLLRLSSFTTSDYNSSSDLSVTHAVKGKILIFNYSWTHENIPQEGMLIVRYDKQQNTAAAAWVDSWHLSNKIMYCKGTINAQGIIDLRGSYEAPPGPDWGWKIIISAPSGNQLQIVMYNSSPEGIEDLAVQADYRRIAQ